MCACGNARDIGAPCRQFTFGGGTARTGYLRSNARSRRVSPVAPRPREGPLTEPTAGAQPRPQERIDDECASPFSGAENTDRAGRYHRRSDLAWCVLWPDRDRGWSAVTVAGQWVDDSRTAGDLRGDAAHEGFADGAANQQDGPQRCARDRADDAGRPVQAGACEDAGCLGTADAADQPQAAS